MNACVVFANRILTYCYNFYYVLRSFYDNKLHRSHTLKFPHAEENSIEVKYEPIDIIGKYAKVYYYFSRTADFSHANFVKEFEGTHYMKFLDDYSVVVGDDDDLVIYLNSNK